MARKKLRRRLARGGAIGAGFVLRTALVGATALWLLDREHGAERRQRLLAWGRSLFRRGRGVVAGQEGAQAARPTPPPAPDRDDTREVERERRGGAASDETDPLRPKAPPVSEGLPGVSWQAEGDTGRQPADDARRDRDRADVDRPALRDPPRGNDDGG